MKARLWKKTKEGDKVYKKNLPSGAAAIYGYDRYGRELSNTEVNRIMLPTYKKMRKARGLPENMPLDEDSGRGWSKWRNLL